MEHNPQTPYPCAVVGAGEIADYPAVASLLADDAFVVCADGGLAHCQGLGVTPRLLVGDFDSLGGGEIPAGLERIALSPDKNYTDSWHAAQESLDRGHRRLLLTGMLGGRLDHTLANLQLLAGCAAQGADALLTDGVVQALAHVGPGELLVPRRADCYFSLLALEQCRGVTIYGGKYPLDDYDLGCADPRAVSNEFAGGDVRVVKASGTLIVLSQPKT